MICGNEPFTLNFNLHHQCQREGKIKSEASKWGLIVEVIFSRLSINRQHRGCSARTFIDLNISTASSALTAEALM